ncbi:HAD-IA family hydrolase [Shewanella eurypsychrophilus]|uniref:HAD-IA family hydrolase n=1 Tax=Shewanella eurypsychrophilus TaxID=2593656 RepID=A0ABX6V1C1_9GAMM|nr:MULTISPECIES: HAD-IA family hydrolase [Shewanella]QFU21130.1 HAD-IA family hydrolase [Shewanella sp. YLB-09]QPG56421.1 HAD-IA family hydrolase [Shewanella eurypsychrophilus]
MKIYLRPHSFSAISFDLDDTLYDNGPIIRAAEQSLLEFLNYRYSETLRWQRTDWLELKKRLILNHPELAHDTTAARLIMLEQGLLGLGYSRGESEEGANAGLNHFLAARSAFTVSKPVIKLLEALSEQYPLIGITNGNVDADKIGLGNVLDFVLHPGQGTRMKPYPDMFYSACRKLDIPLHSLLHVGDSHVSDVQGARLAGCQSAWLNPKFDGAKSVMSHGLLPHVEVSSLQELIAFL